MRKTNDEFYDYNNNQGNNGSGDEYENNNANIINDDRKRYTKPSIVRLEYKTRYNTSKIVIQINPFLFLPK